jgi:hypothetical protein
LIATVSRYAFRIVVALLTIGILVVGTFFVLVAVPDMAGDIAEAPRPGRTHGPSPSPRSAMALSPVGIEMPGDANCNSCHLTGSGLVGTKPIPVMGHPLAGWRDCTACHTVGSLVQTAAGHTSLHKDDCLICHQTRVEAGASEKPELRPEHMGTEQTCSSCHGIDDHAPLPASMRGRGDNCWICHNGPEFTYLFEDNPAPASGAPASGAPGASLAPGASEAPASPAADDVGYVLQVPIR